jgi:lipopolysaccharide transport system ATP-binding protein
MDKPIISIENIGKKYLISHHQEGRSNYVALRDVISDISRRYIKKLTNPFSKNEARSFSKEEFWALRNISFDINKGDRIGIIGRNGAGKSTLLKILSRITEPTEGRIKINGRVASLLEVGTGFHPELTGRENIYLNGAILGMKKAEIDKKFDEIVDFAEVEKFLDTPVKHFSSGMYVRLAFAVAAHLEPEILLVDEVLAVGDAEFQKKCLGKMEDVSTREGRTVFFVSHNMAAVAALCNRGVLLQKGSLICDASAQECISIYLEKMHHQKEAQDLAKVPRISNLTGEARITGFSIHNVDSDNDVIDADKPCKAELVFEVLEDNVSVGGEFLISDGIQKMCLFHSGIRNNLNPVFKKGIHKLICHTGSLSLYSGTYYVTLALTRPGVPIDYIENAVSIDVELPHREGSMYDFKKMPGSSNFYIEHSWEYE